MPNTLAHIGLHTLLTRSLVPGANIKWIWLGVVLPDIPFVIKRAISFAKLDVDILDIRLLSVVQASLLFSIVLAFACAQFSSRMRKTFLIISLGVVIHLLMDACQIKWGNGPRLFVPFDWSVTGFGLFWPEQIPSHLLTGIGVVTVLFIARMPVSSQAEDLVMPKMRGRVIAGTSLIIYLVAPLAFFSAAEQSGAGSVELIRQADRTGFEIELDRARFRREADGDVVELYAGHFIDFDGLQDDVPASGKVSVRGTFIRHDAIQASEYQLNFAGYREMASVVGLSVILLYWLIILHERSRRRELG